MRSAILLREVTLVTNSLCVLCVKYCCVLVEDNLIDGYEKKQQHNQH